MNSNKKLLAIVGPTVTGKTDLALNFAKKLNGELVSCDSRQVYKGLDIGSNKLPSNTTNIKRGSNYWLVEGVKIWMLDVVDPRKQYTVDQYFAQAKATVLEIGNQGKLPIIVGGTGLYLKALIDGLSNLNIPTNPKLREELEALSLEQLQQRLKEEKLSAWKKLNNSDRKNKRRLLRSLELIYMYPYTLKKKDNTGLSFDHQILKIGLSASRQFLNNKIDLRILNWFKQGFIEEGAKIVASGIDFNRLRQLGLEYRYLADYLEHKITKEQLIDILKIKNHQYAKRQMTWFKKDQQILWFDISDKSYLKKVEKSVLDWYNQLS